MKLPTFDFVEAQSVRRAVVAEGDIRGDIGFQNDINVLLDRLEGANPGLQALGLVQEAVTQPVIALISVQRRIADLALRVIEGGSGRAKSGEAFKRAAAPRGA
jgi:hypothetical protein